jgi:hypothetical protein
VTKEQATRLIELYDQAVASAVRCAEEAFDENSTHAVRVRLAANDRHADAAFRKFVEGLSGPR